MKNILLIDDDPDLCQLTKMVLTKSGYNVNAFLDARSGINNAKEIKPDLILMDIILPGITGTEIVSILKEDDYFKYIPVIFLTGLVTGTENSIQNEGINVHGVLYPTLGKPYEIEHLLAIVGKYVK
jgi:DNA-binding response OmpR family regulator